MVRSELSKEFGKPLLPYSFGGVSYYSLCDLRSTINVISNTFYHEILEDISPSLIRGTDINVQMADRTLSLPLVIVKNVYLNVGPYTFVIELVVIDMPPDPLCPNIFGRTLLNHLNAQIDSKDETISLRKIK
jgi:hypothetical protein